MAKQDTNGSTPGTAAVAENLYAGKFTTPEELANAYEEIQKKMGEQGSELGKLRDTASRAEQLEQVIAQQYQQLQQVAPLQQWFQQNQQGLNNYIRWMADQQNTQNQQTDSTMPLAQDEIKRLQDRFIQDVLNPYDQQLTKRASEIEQKVYDTVGKRMQDNIAWIYNHLAGALPEDKRKELERRTEMALKYANPQNADPMAWANEAFQAEQDKLNLESRLKERDDEIESLKAKLAPAAYTGNAGNLFGEATHEADEAASKDRATREKILNQVKDESGDAFYDVFKRAL